MRKMAVVVCNVVNGVTRYAVTLNGEATPYELFERVYLRTGSKVQVVDTRNPEGGFHSGSVPEALNKVLDLLRLAQLALSPTMNSDAQAEAAKALTPEWLAARAAYLAWGGGGRSSQSQTRHGVYNAAVRVAELADAARAAKARWQTTRTEKPFDFDLCEVTRRAAAEAQRRHEDEALAFAEHTAQAQVLP